MFWLIIDCLGLASLRALSILPSSEEKAKNACVNAGEMVDNHFPQVEKLVAIGSGVLYERGVDSKGFAIIRSKGDKDAKTDHNIR